MTRPILRATAIGRGFDLAHPSPQAISAGLIARHLSQINRWCGATLLPINVAQHSVLVARACTLPRARLYALLHDAHEALIGDISTPVQQALDRELPGFAKALDAYKARLDLVVWAHFELPPPDEVAAIAVAEADRTLAATEWRDLIPDQDFPNPFAGQRTLATRIRPVTPAVAEAEFLEALASLVAVHRRAA